MKIWDSELKEIEALQKTLRNGLPELGKELGWLLESNNDNMVLVCARRSLEVIITDLCNNELGRPRKSEPLQGIIDKLNKEEKVPSYIISSMSNLNSISTYGAHPKEFDPNNFTFLDTKGWGLYKQGKYNEANEVLQRSWDLYRQRNVYFNPEMYLHLEASKKAVAREKK